MHQKVFASNYPFHRALQGCFSLSFRSLGQPWQSAGPRRPPSQLLQLQPRLSFRILRPPQKSAGPRRPLRRRPSGQLQSRQPFRSL
ncbi:hypothetical protein TNCT_652481 [Trichonephila clavata]|uniref:Uncharacterized protein n=1 Tax=Trichonephila clavata TaxID=2740835 RepID=A0A8X6GAW5_TRICU|nr:hypothetical protein TNCT_652481 [Trichonephila clavata]